jgi:hypothetical protein
MADFYTIYVVNQSANSQLFWAFLSQPVITNAPQVFANSNTNLQIPGGSTNLNSFTIPVQYIIGSGASNNAVGLDTIIESNATRKVKLTQLYDVAYSDVPPKQGPTMGDAPSPAMVSPETTVGMRTNAFNQTLNTAQKWYENMSFGVKTSQGFMGVTWKPAPSLTYTITPNLVFYIAVGSYSSCSLANINLVSNESAICDPSQHFDLVNQCTVTYSQTGTWSIAKGNPTVELLNSPKDIMISSLRRS